MKEKLIEAIDKANTGYWDDAHFIVQQIEDKTSYWLHANLHREEGDRGNAHYWYNRAGREYPDIPIVEEREAIRRVLNE